MGAASVTRLNSPHGADPRTDGCPSLIRRTANNAPRTPSNAKQKPGHQCGTAALELLAKYFKLLTDKVEHTDGDGDNVRVLWIGEKKATDGKQ
jgi:hypothetical protein